MRCNLLIKLYKIDISHTDEKLGERVEKFKAKRRDEKWKN